MLKKTVPTLIVAALTALGAVQLAHAQQKNYTEGGDLYSGSRAKDKANPNQNPAKSGKFDPYTDGARKSTRTDLAPRKADPYTDGARGGTRDPYLDGARTGARDPYTDGAKTGKPDPYTDGAKK